MSAGHDTTGRPDPDRARDAAVATMLTGEASGASSADPIFAAIEESRRLDALHDGFLDALAGAPEDHPEKANQHAAHDASWRCWREAVLTTVPQTAGGCQALASYAGAWFKMQGANDADAETVLALIARSPMLPSPAPSSDLAEACVEQVKRLRHWDAHPDSLSEAEWDAEMDRWGAVTRRAIEEPSAGPRDLAGKACLSLHDMDRFLPERTHPYDLHRLLRVILREAIDMGGIAGPASRPTAEEGATHSDAALLSAINEHRLAERAFHAGVNPADDEWVRQNGGDTSESAMAAPRKASAEAEARASQAWRDLFKIRPRTWHHLWIMLNYVAEHFDDHQGMDDEPDVFGALIGAVNGLRISSEELTATHDLSLLSINELNHLADLCRHQSRVLAAFGTSHSERPLGVVLDAESTRLAILGDHARDEIDRRRPTDEFDRELRLETLIRADLAGNGYIEPALLAEAVAAWGTR